MNYFVVTQSVFTTFILAWVVYKLLKTVERLCVPDPKNIIVENQGTGMEKMPQMPQETVVTPQKTNFYPDVEMDEWMNEFGMPTTPGWGGPEPPA